MNDNELVKIIEETILEMLEEEDETLLQLMMEHETNISGEGVSDKETFLNETIDRLKDKMGIITEDEEVDENDPILLEQKKMLGLVEWLEKDEE